MVAILERVRVLVGNRRNSFRTSVAPRPRRVGEASRSRRVHPASTVFFGSLAGLWVLALLLGQTPAMAQDDDRIWVPYTSTNTDSGSSSVTVPRGQGYGQTVPEITPDLQRIYQQTIPGQARPQGLPSQGTFQEPGQLLIEKGPKKPTFAEEALPGLPPQPFETKEEKKEKAEALLLDRAKKTIEDEEPQPPPVRLAPAIEEPASSIEKAYRLQYSDVILDQLSVLEHAEPPEVQKREDEEELDSLRVKEEKPRYPDADIVEKYFTQFGYDLFKERAFRASEKMIVSDDYRLGPGDVLRVNMWGAGADVQFHGVIEPDGTISLPRLGVIPLAGTRFGDLERIITTEANKHFQGVDISVAIVRPRSVEVYVVGPGQASRPDHDPGLFHDADRPDPGRRRAEDRFAEEHQPVSQGTAFPAPGPVRPDHSRSCRQRRLSGGQGRHPRAVHRSDHRRGRGRAPAGHF